MLINEEFTPETIEEVDQLPSFKDLLAAAEALDKAASPTEISKVATDCAALDKISQRKVLEAVKRRTGIPLSTLKEAQKGESQGEPDHLALAQIVIKAVGELNVIGTQAMTWRYASGVWRPMEPRAEKQLVQENLAEAEEITRSLVDSVADVFRTEIYQTGHTWNVGPSEAVCVPNGELQLTGGQWVLREHCREYFRTVQVPIEYDPEADAPRFRQFLREIFRDDPDRDEKAKAILELIGYTLMAHTRYEKFIMLVGGGANGKSVLLFILETLLGRENVAGVQPSQFDRSFQRAHLHLKLANIVTEIREGETIADAELKSIVSGEPTTVEHKFRDPFEMRPYATCWFGTNHMPHTRDFSDALFRRALVIPFNRKFTAGKDADPRLKEKLLEELPGILNLALDAYARVVQTGDFTEPESCKEAKHQWRLNADQAAQFVADCCHEADTETGSTELWRAYVDWADDAGVHHKLTQRNFSQRLERLGYPKRRTRVGRVFAGLALGVTDCDACDASADIGDSGENYSFSGNSAKSYFRGDGVMSEHASHASHASQHGSHEDSEVF